MPDEDRSAVMDEDRRKQEAVDGPAARNRERLDDDIAEQGSHGSKDQPRDDDDDRRSDR